MIRTSLVALVFIFFSVSGGFAQDKLINKFFIPSDKIASFSLPHFQVNCVGGGCSERFIKESAPLIGDLAMATFKHFHTNENEISFNVRVVAREYFKELISDFPKKKKFLFFGEKRINAVLQGNKNSWMVTIPRFSSIEDLGVVWIAFIKAIDTTRFGEDFINDKEAERIAKKILRDIQKNNSRNR